MNALQLKPGQIFRRRYWNGMLSVEKYIAGTMYSERNMRVAQWDENKKWISHILYMGRHDDVVVET